MTKTYTFNGNAFEVSTCTAIALEAYSHERRDALYVTSGEDGDEKSEWVVFNWYKLPETDDDFEDIIEDIWTRDCDTLSTVRFDKDRKPHTTFTYANCFKADFMDTDEENAFANDVFAALFDIVISEWLSWYPDGEFTAYCDDEVPEGWEWDIDEAIRRTWEIIDGGDVADYIEEYKDDLFPPDFFKNHFSYIKRAVELHRDLEAKAVEGTAD